MKRYTVMICDQFEEVTASSEEEAKANIEEKVKTGIIELCLIAWEAEK